MSNHSLPSSGDAESAIIDPEVFGDIFAMYDFVSDSNSVGATSKFADLFQGYLDQYPIPVEASLATTYPLQNQTLTEPKENINKAYELFEPQSDFQLPAFHDRDTHTTGEILTDSDLGALDNEILFGLDGTNNTTNEDDWMERLLFPEQYEERNIATNTSDSAGALAGSEQCGEDLVETDDLGYQEQERLEEHNLEEGVVQEEDVKEEFDLGLTLDSEDEALLNELGFSTTLDDHEILGDGVLVDQSVAEDIQKEPFQQNLPTKYDRKSAHSQQQQLLEQVSTIGNVFLRQKVQYTSPYMPTTTQQPAQQPAQKAIPSNGTAQNPISIPNFPISQSQRLCGVASGLPGFSVAKASPSSVRDAVPKRPTNSSSRHAAIVTQHGALQGQLLPQSMPQHQLPVSAIAQTSAPAAGSTNAASIAAAHALIAKTPWRSGAKEGPYCKQGPHKNEFLSVVMNAYMNDYLRHTRPGQPLPKNHTQKNAFYTSFQPQEKQAFKQYVQQRVEAQLPEDAKTEVKRLRQGGPTIVSGAATNSTGGLAGSGTQDPGVGGRRKEKAQHNLSSNSDADLQGMTGGADLQPQFRRRGGAEPGYPHRSIAMNPESSQGRRSVPKPPLQQSHTSSNMSRLGMSSMESPYGSPSAGGYYHQIQNQSAGGGMYGIHHQDQTSNHLNVAVETGFQQSQPLMGDSALDSWESTRSMRPGSRPNFSSYPTRDSVQLQRSQIEQTLRAAGQSVEVGFGSFGSLDWGSRVTAGLDDTHPPGVGYSGRSEMGPSISGLEDEHLSVALSDIARATQEGQTIQGRKRKHDEETNPVSSEPPRPSKKARGN